MHRGGVRRPPSAHLTCHWITLDSEGPDHEILISFCHLPVFGPWRGSRYRWVATLIVEHDGAR